MTPEERDLWEDAAENFLSGNKIISHYDSFNKIVEDIYDRGFKDGFDLARGKKIKRK